MEFLLTWIIGLFHPGPHGFLSSTFFSLSYAEFEQSSALASIEVKIFFPFAPFFYGRRMHEWVSELLNATLNFPIFSMARAFMDGFSFSLPPLYLSTFGLNSHQ
jgi:hypothetical protein